MLYLPIPGLQALEHPCQVQFFVKQAISMGGKKPFQVLKGGRLTWSLEEGAEAQLVCRVQSLPCAPQVLKKGQSPAEGLALDVHGGHRQPQ